MFSFFIYIIRKWGLNAWGEMNFEFKIMLYCIHTNLQYIITYLFIELIIYNKLLFFKVLFDWCICTNPIYMVSWKKGKEENLRRTVEKVALNIYTSINKKEVE